MLVSSAEEDARQAEPVNRAGLRSRHGTMQSLTLQHNGHRQFIFPLFCLGSIPELDMPTQMCDRAEPTPPKPYKHPTPFPQKTPTPLSLPDPSLSLSSLISLLSFFLFLIPFLIPPYLFLRLPSSLSSPIPSHPNTTYLSSCRLSNLHPSSYTTRFLPFRAGFSLLASA